MQICERCSYPMESCSYTMCFTCWKEVNGWKEVEGDVKYAELQKIIKGLLVEGGSSELEYLRERVKELEEDRHRLSMDLIESQSNLELAMGQIILDPSFLKRLLKFCHPDRNPNKVAEADELTKVLIRLRGKNRG